MKNLLKSGLVLALISLSSSSFAQIKNAKTAKVKVHGNCEMCEATIEKAINQKNLTFGDWNKDSKILTVQYDGARTDLKKLLRKVAEAGYDNQYFTAPDKTYQQLPQCCQYKRPESNTKNPN